MFTKGDFERTPEYNVVPVSTVQGIAPILFQISIMDLCVSEKSGIGFVGVSLLCSILLEGESSIFRSSEVVCVLDFFVLKNFSKFIMQTLH